jgi:protease I
MDTKRVAILVDNYFEQSEFEEPLETLRDAGLDVVVVATQSKELQALVHADKGDTFEADMLLADVTPDEFDALVLPGGVVNADKLRMVEPAKQWVRDFLEGGKLVAAICHAPWLLVSADEVQGRKLTSYFTIQDDIDNAGGEWIDQPVVVDENLITSRKPDDIPSFSEAILTALMVNVTEDEEESEDEVRLHGLGYDKKRDELTDKDEEDILGDTDDDPDATRLSRATSKDEQDGTQ